MSDNEVERAGEREDTGGSRLVYPLSYGQEGLWFDYLKSPDAYTYNIPCIVRLQGEVDISRLASALRNVLQKHPCLRIQIGFEEGLPTQILSREFELDFQVVQVHGHTEQQVKEALVRDYQRPFNLEEKPVCRFRLFSCSEEDHYFLYMQGSEKE